MFCVSGSSPLARGLLTASDELVRAGRIIPARAGFTRGRGSGSWSGPDHPRSRGVYLLRRMSSFERDGSSPLARGLHSAHCAGTTRARIIPARAGFTAHVEIVLSLFWDHPRSRGVYETMGISLQFVAGSSPLARGLPVLGPVERRFGRIIPARAGFTSGGSRSRCRRSDHPRSRGVYDGVDRGEKVDRGSSPLARGLPPVQSNCAPVWRIIPARAGFTW